MNLFKREPVMTTAVAGAIVTIAAAFGLSLTVDQVLAVASLVSFVVGLIARSQVTPVA